MFTVKNVLFLKSIRINRFGKTINHFGRCQWWIIEQTISANLIISRSLIVWNNSIIIRLHSINLFFFEPYTETPRFQVNTFFGIYYIDSSSWATTCLSVCPHTTHRCLKIKPGSAVSDVVGRLERLIDLMISVPTPQVEIVLIFSVPAPMGWRSRNGWGMQTVDRNTSNKF